jgi:hypothetical protein
MFPVGRSDVDMASWDEFAASLAATLPRVDDKGFLSATVRADEDALPAPIQTKNWLSRLESSVRSMGRGSNGTDPPFLLIMRVDCHLMLECGGPKDLRGPVALSADQQTQILAMGWADPRSRDKRGWAEPNYRAYFPNEGVVSKARWIKGGAYEEVVDFAAVARFCVETFRGPLEVSDPRQLWVKRS